MKRHAKRIVFTGGGTAGHVIPNLPLIEELTLENYEVLYIGSFGIEGSILHEQGIRFRAVMTGKLRRYFSWRNFLDMFKVLTGIIQSLIILFRFKPALVFSKGGFVSVPVCLAAKILSIPVLAHESDLTPGLATKIVARFAKIVFCAFPETGRHLPGVAVKVVGLPLRKELKLGNRSKGLAYCGFPDSDSRPILLVMGGSLGAQLLNEALVASWPKIKKQWRVIHLTGEGKQTQLSDADYRQFPFVGQALPDVMALADVVLSRAGATSLFELLHLQKPMLLVPLLKGSRGDQVLNAEYFARQGYAKVLSESELNGESLVGMLQEIWTERLSFVEAMRKGFTSHDALRAILNEIHVMTRLVK